VANVSSAPVTLLVSRHHVARSTAAVLNSARVIAYAFVDDVEYRKWGSLYVGDKLLEHVPQLAICVNLAANMGPLLFHCDENWNVLGVSGAETVEAVKARAERNYPGVMSRWIDLNTSNEYAPKYYDTQSGGLRCSFCGKRPFETDGWIEGQSAVICRACVEEYYREFQTSSGHENAG
jgi:ClpX C4-type zinc finger protein